MYFDNSRRKEQTMYVDQLTESTVSIADIFLDPNNPRFWTEKQSRDYPDSKIVNEDIQAKAENNLSNHGIDELADNILRNGFLPLDRIVVRPIAGDAGKYVVVEGNRRLAALRSLRSRIQDDLIAEEHIDEAYLEKLLNDTSELQVLVYQGADTKDIAWLLQGIRHISGIRDWKPAQRARLVARQIDEEGLGFREAGQQFGLTAQAVGRLYRSYKALEQMRADDEFQTKAKNDYFTLFEEAIRNKDVKQWLEWTEEDKKFNNIDNLRQFYSWISPDDDHEDNARRMHDPRQIKKLGILIAGNHKSMLTQIDQHDLPIDSAHDRAVRAGQVFNWKEALEQARLAIAEIPQAAVAEHPKEIFEKLTELESGIASLKKMAQAIEGTLG